MKSAIDGNKHMGYGSNIFRRVTLDVPYVVFTVLMNQHEEKSGAKETEGTVTSSCSGALVATGAEDVGVLGVRSEMQQLCKTQS